MQLINRLLLWQRFILLGIIVFALSGGPFYLYFHESTQGLNVARNEQLGVNPLRLVMGLYKAVQDDRGLAVQLLSGVKSVTATQAAKQNEIDERIAAIDAIATQDNWNDAMADHWQVIKTDLSRIALSVAKKSVTAKVTRQQHHDAIAKIHILREYIANHYNLFIDPEKTSFHIVKALVYDIIRISDPMGLIRGSGADILFRSYQEKPGATKAELTNDAEIVNLIQRVASARDGLAIFKLSIKNAMLNHTVAKADLETGIQQLVYATEHALKLTEQEIIYAKTINYDFQDYRRTVSQAIESINNFNEILLITLDKILQQRITNLEHERTMLLLLELGLGIFGILFGILIVRSILTPINHLVGVIHQLAKGNFSARATLDSPDEIGELAQQFNQMINQHEITTHNMLGENEELNNSVILLLEAVSKLSQKDLTVRAPVAQDLTGPLGDALNMLTAETARVLQRISDISVDVTQSSLSVREQADLVSSVADSEREQVERTAVELDNAALTMLRIAKLAQATNVAADKATLTTQNAIDIVNATIASIEFIRETVRDAGGRIELLGIHSQEISSVVDLIGGIARRTQILAVSASMHAASAGEAGHGFQVIANEVQRLAETAQQAAAKIGALLANIQSEVIDTVLTMNNVTKQVIDGSKLAEHAGEQMRITQRTTSDLVTSVQIIAESSQEQAQASADLLNRAHNIRKSTQLTSKQLKSQTIQTENLVKYARTLLNVVQVFKLPA